MSLDLRGGKWFYRKTINGHSIARSTKTSDRKLAEQISACWEAEHVKSILIAGVKPVNLHAAIKAFLKSRSGTVGHANAEVHLRHFLALPDQPIKSVMLADLMNVVQKRRSAGISENTLAVTVGYWNAVMNHCKKQGWQEGIRLDRIQGGESRKRFLSPEEEAKLFQAIDPHASFRGRNPSHVARRQDNCDLLLGLLHIGCRLNELQKMKWSQIDIKERTVWVVRSKRGVDSHVAMTDRLHEMLVRRRALVGADAVHVFPHKAKAKVNTNWINAAVKRAGLDVSQGNVTLHVMRHSHASRLLDGGMSVLEVQQQLGHRHIQSTTVYLHADNKASSRKAAGILNGKTHLF